MPPDDFVMVPIGTTPVPPPEPPEPEDEDGEAHRRHRAAFLSLLPERGREREVDGVGRGKYAILAIADAIWALDRGARGEIASAAHRVIDAAYRAGIGREPDVVARMTLLECVDEGATCLLSGYPPENESCMLSSLDAFAEQWPVHAKRIKAQAFCDAVRSWAATRTGAGSYSWPPAARLVESAGLGPQNPETLKRQWAQWRKTHRSR